MTCLATITIACVAVVCVGMTSVLHPVPTLIWNASASVPIGLYAVKRASIHQVGDLVVVRPPEALAVFLDTRGYLARGLPLLKHTGPRQCKASASRPPPSRLYRLPRFANK